MIYLDNASTTKPAKEVVDIVKKTSRDYYANPSSSHQLGSKAKDRLNEARKKVAQFLNCLPEEIVFTSGGTESNNLALKGLVDSLLRKEKNNKIEIITTKIEHKSVLETIAHLGKNYSLKTTYLKPNKSGLIMADSLKKAINQQTRLVSVMFVNNETGVVQPIEEIGKIIEAINKDRPPNKQVYFHVDGVQAVEYQKIDLKKLAINLLSISAHKFHGPKGIGLLYIKKNTPLNPNITGGGQESNLRSGTENLPGIVGLSQALELINDKDNQKVIKLGETFEKELRNSIADIKINGEQTKRSPHISSVIFSKAEGESIMFALDLEGVASSTGSACNAQDLKASHVLLAQGLKPEEAQSTLRLSFSKNNTQEEIKQVIKKLETIIPKLRKISPTNL